MAQKAKKKSKLRHAEYYDMQGRRQNGLQKGMNIVKRGSKTIKVIVNK